MHEQKMNQALHSLKLWLVNGLEFTLGNPHEERHMPPSIGPQPYRDKPLKSH